MAPRSNPSFLRVTCCALALALFLCPVSSFRRLHVTQGDEDLTFDDDEDAVLSRHRREMEHRDDIISIRRRQQRQATGLPLDDELEGSGFPESNIQTYRIKFLRDETYYSKLSDRTSQEFNSLKLTLENKFSSLFKDDPPGEVSVHVASIGSGDKGKQEVLMDITHRPEEGATSSSSPRIQMKMEEALSSGYYQSVPGSLVFDEVEGPISCKDQEIECDGKCLPLSKTCDGTKDCTDGRDEESKYCPPTVNECNSDEFRCKDGSCIASYRRCDFAQDCLGNEDEEFCPCKPPNFQCISGHCVKGSKRCDGFHDCDDGTDEFGCSESDHCEGSGEFVCDDGDTCLDITQVCDGTRDCDDNTDETSNCGGSEVDTTGTPLPNDRLCPAGHHKCGDGSCIQIDFKCDGKSDCSDESDETGCVCNMRVQWQCDFGECIDLRLRCDIKEDCPRDNSDERNCPTPTPACQPPEKFLCNTGVCIDGSKRCDGTNNCQDKSDEIDCPSCSEEEIRCDVVKCIGQDKICDQNPDCLDGADEFNCSTPTSCSIDQFRCDDGTCLGIDQRCNGQEDCLPNGEDEKSCSCRADQFKCSSGNCIAGSKKCDGVNDCPFDGSDEENCPLVSKLCLEDQFQCTNGQCIPIGFTCDGLPDCNDGSDEMQPACKDQEEKCTDLEFKCNNGHCIDLIRRCDHSPDCLDESDETGCPAERKCTSDEFTCGDSSCISKAWRCDQVSDCVDGSDEIGCTCKANEFACGNGQCISESLMCDANFDCADGSDEKSCPCSDTEFKCKSGECVALSAVCDFNNDCSDRSDEENCGTVGKKYKPSKSQPTVTERPSLGPFGCSPSQFECQNGQCVPSEKRCNTYFDCADLSDEVDCPPEPCTSREFTCLSGDGECVDVSLKCNGDPDCSDASDELGCPESDEFSKCGSFEFHCRSGECISQATVCDSRNDCLDNSDEANCPGSGAKRQCDNREFSCGDGTCVSLLAFCDGRFDCPDGSDESNCVESGQKCRSDEFRCDDGQCVSGIVKCDGRSDCLDSSDERFCPQVTPPPPPPPTSPPRCHPSEFRCLSGECIPHYLRCDRNFDCRDQSDEANCPRPTPPPAPPTPAPLRCRPDEFTCRSGDCIDSRRRCDKTPDCRDGSDEYDCPLDCREGEFRCKDDGSCIPDYLKCDGVPDCHDRSDETGCQIQCRSNEYTCRSGQCIDARRHCDRSYDCLDRSDEENCPSTARCRPDEYTCRSGDCIDARRRCDRNFDCRDRSDEDSCPTETFTCYNGIKIEKSKHCDGRNDCPDGSDEHGCRPQPPHPPTQPTEGLNLRTYPDEQTIKQSREVVFQCRDEGPLRKPVRWLRAGQRLPPGTTDIRGRLTMPNIQIDHSGSYICEVQGVATETVGRRKTVTLQVVPFEYPTVAPSFPVCLPSQATCFNGECIPKDAICDGDNDCSDGSDEARCDPLGCEPNEFQCDNKQCVGKTWLCDADDDCGDGSDERNCDGPLSSSSNCTNYEFTCQAGNQCIPRSFHCDNEIDCQDRSDEVGCSKPTIVEPPPRTLTVDISVTFTITCKAIGIPMPIVVWRLNWGHVPPTCTMTSERGYGVLTCTNTQPHHQGAYSCEAINSLGSVFAEPDAIVQVNTGESICPPPKFNSGAVSEEDCLNCFCFGVIDQCYSTDRFVSQLPPPESDIFQIVGVNQNQFRGNYVIRDRDYPLSPRYLRPIPGSASVSLDVRDRNRLGGPSDLLVYFSLPDSHKGSQLTAYGGYLRYNVLFTSSVGQLVRGPDVILRGNNMTLMHVHDHTFEANRRNQIDVRFYPGQWFKKVINRGGRVQSQEPASRFDILMALENIELLLIRASYTDGSFIETTVSDVQLDTAVFRQTNQGRAIYVEECRCPPGYSGISCEKCAPNYRRVSSGPYLGRCVLDVACGPSEYGDPANGIPCLPCPCPLTNPANQFGQSCYLDTDGQVTCNCQVGYQGRRCEICADGYEGNPNIPGEQCQPVGECDSAGSRLSVPDPNTGLCQCKDYATGPKCSQCQPDAFFLHDKNQYGCIKCVCMGITNKCASSNWYRTEETINFVSSTQGVQLVDQYQKTVITNNLFTDSGRQELVYRRFSDISPEVYYWRLPQKFLGDKVHSYGGNVTYSLRYIPAPGGQSSRNNAYDVEIYGNDVTLRYYSKEQHTSSAINTVSVPFYEQYWQRQDGQIANREHFLMALADLEYILIKATYTTNTLEVGLKDVSMDTAVPRNTGQERAYAVEMCECPEGYRGLSCEDCDIGYTRGLSGVHLGTCEPCNCNGHSNDCDPESGACFNCRENRAGESCEVCAEGYYEDFSGRCVRTQPCTCDHRGSISTQCHNDQCQCKGNVEGDECRICKDGNFFLSEKNEEGCSKCWCSSVTNRCSSSQYFREQIPMNLFPGHGFTLSDRLRTNVIDEGFEIDVPENQISYRQFDQLSPQTTYYWSLPQLFTGNRLTSYGGKLSITQSFDSRSTSDIYSDADVIITSADKREFIWMNEDPLRPSQLQNFTVELVESMFTVDQRPSSREEFLEALSSVEAILIRAQFSESMISTNLQYVTLDTAVDYQTGQSRALEVEQCSCPSEYIGFSCEECAQGYYRDSRTNRCFRCPCNGKEESCVAERSGVVRCNCMAGFTGIHCGVSVNDSSSIPSGTLEIYIPQAIYNTEVGATIQLVCQVKSSTGTWISVTWDKEGTTSLPYGRASDNKQGILEITQVRPEDAGIYVCRASHGSKVSEERTQLVVSGGPPPSRPVVVIEERRHEVQITIGQYFEVRCRGSGSPLPDLQWIRADGRPLSTAATQRNGVLAFRNPQLVDSGSYICSGRNAEGSASATITILVEEQHGTATEGPEDYIIVQVSSEDIEATPGETVKVTCTVPHTSIRASFSWTRVENTLPEQAYQKEGDLIIPNALPVDSGLYTCRVSDSRGRVGEATTRINIAFTGNLPVVRIEPDRQAIDQGTSAELKCIASGNPKPIIKWSKINEELGRNVVVSGERGELLRVNNAAINDRGMYVCTATNEIGKARGAAILEVERREPPVVEMYPDSRQVIERGYSAMFQCHLTGGIPTPVVTWARSDGRPLTPNTATLNGGVIRFNQVTGEEEGSYICTAANDAGKMTATATLEIQAVPVITLRPGSSPYRVQVGERIHLECSAEGDPAPSVKWQRLQVNYEQDIPGRSLTTSRAVYEIASATLNDQGTYQCSATNSVGTSIERIQVLVQDTLPGYPRPPVEAGIIRPRPPYVQPPTAPTSTEPYQVPLGGEFQFRCYAEAEGSPEGKVEDLLFSFRRSDGRPLPQGYREGSGVLTLTNVGQDAEGEYACIVKERSTSRVIITIYSTLEVVEQPRVRLEPARQVVRPGDTVSLRCIVTGAQPITINWSRETGSMPSSVIINGGEILFRGIATTDAGKYICEAVNSVGRATSVAEVIVNERPLLTALQNHVTVSEGQNAQLRCEVSGVNPSTVQWVREGGSLPRNSYPSGTILRINNAKPEDIGRYKCEARTPLGVYTYDFINFDVRSSVTVEVRIKPSRNNVRLGEPIDLHCDVVGDPHAVVVWSKLGSPLPYNVLAEGRSLRIGNVQPNNGGVYVCTATTATGVVEKHYPLAIQNALPETNTYGHGSRSVETRSVKFGSEVVLECGVKLTPPVSFTWSKQGGQLPVRARIQDDKIEIPEAQADDAGTFICTARNEEDTEDVPILLIVTGVVPRFSGDSYLSLPTLPDAYLIFDIEISFKPETPEGLILYNSQRDGPGDFISFGLSDSHAEFRFDVGSGPAILRSDERLTLGEWHTVKLSRNRKEGSMTVNGGTPVTGKSVGRFQGLDLINPLYIGGVPDITLINDQSGFSSGFYGCVSRLVIGFAVSELMRDTRSHNRVVPCDTCSENPCNNGGVCQEAYSPKGHKCICPAGFSGESCKSTGESCYPGVCGTGRCINRPGGLECFCPFGLTGPRCEQSISIYEPSFARGAYMAYPTPRALKRFSLGMNVKPTTLEDGLIMYCGQQERGEGDFTSLTMRNKRLEFKFNTGTGTALLQSDEIAPGEWIKIHANRTDKLGSLQIDDGPVKNAQAPGASRSLNLRTPLFIGGVDSSKIEVAPDVHVTNGFTGCISELKIMDQQISIADSLVDSANVDQCGVSPCSREPCQHDGLCQEDADVLHGFTCKCPSGYSGPRCEVKDGGICLNGKPCLNGGACKDLGEGVKECLCPLGFTGPSCEHESFLTDSASFNKRSWIEVDRYLLPQSGISEQVVTVLFSTTEPNGLLLWHGQEPLEDGLDKDYLSLALVNGYLEFSFHMDKEVVKATSEIRVDDGLRHSVTIKKSSNSGSLFLDDLEPVHEKGVESLFSFNTHGNIYIGGTPDLQKMTGDLYPVGFTGCVHGLKIGLTKIENFMDYALTGVNVTPCANSNMVHSHHGLNSVENEYPSIYKHTSISTKSVSSRKIYHA